MSAGMSAGFHRNHPGRVNGAWWPSLLWLAALVLPAATAGARPGESDANQSWLAALTAGARIGSFEAGALYLAGEDGPLGARFTHVPSGMPVDILLFDSVPQAMIWVRTLPDSDRGEAHTVEHLVLGKGRKGRSLGLALDMALGSNSAHTARCQTVYHFHTAGGRQTFLDLLFRHLDAFLRPDFTDEEIRREVAHWGVDDDASTGALALEEKGSVYLEMLSSFEEPGTILWSEVRRLLYGHGHPLGLESGGKPEAIRTMEPAHIRAFLERCYRPGTGFGLILGLPRQYEIEPFLGDLDGVLRKACNGALANSDTRAGSGDDALFHLPPFRPPAEPLIARFGLPSTNPAEQGAAVIAWAPRDSLTAGDRMRLELLWYLIAGDETSYLHRDLVDGSTRKIAGGVAAVSGWVHADPGHPPMVWLSGLDPAAQSEEALGRIRAVVAERLTWLASLPADSPEIAALNQRAHAYLIAARRDCITRTETPPLFGVRHTGSFWYDLLFDLSQEPGFRKDVLREGLRRQIEVELDDPSFWPRLVQRMGLGIPPLVVAVYPDTSLPAAQASAKAERVAQALAALERHHATADAQEALRRYRAEFDAATAQIETQETAIGQPGFLVDPPLTLDDAIDTRLAPLVLNDPVAGSSEVPVCENRFGRMQTVDLGLYFDVTGTAREDLLYLAILPQLLTELGCHDEGGAWLAYDELQRRLQREVSDVRAAYSATPCEGGSRVELAAYATGLGLDEGRAALAWTVRLLSGAAHLDAAGLPRLRDVVRREISSLRQAPLRSEETWAENPAEAYRYQRDAIFLSARSIFTACHHLERIGWRLRASPGDAGIDALAHHWSDFLGRWDGARQGLRAELDRMDAGSPPLPEIARELTAYLRTELESLPDETLREDATALYGQALDDLRLGPETVLADLSRIVSGLLRQGPSRAHLSGSAENVAVLRPELDVALARLAAGSPGSGSPGALASDRRPGRSPLGAGAITENLRGRYPWIKPGVVSRPPYAALVIGSSRNALFTHSVRLANYAPPRRGKFLDCLAARLYAGAGAHSLFMRTWGAGLAYSNGIGTDLHRGFAHYYAERCTDGVATLRFSAGVLRAAAETIDGPYYLDYALAGCFGEYRGSDTYVRRGRAMATDLADGITPDQVRRFKEGLLGLRGEWQNAPGPADVRAGSPAGGDPTAAHADLLAEIRSRLPEVVGPLIPGYGLAAGEAWGSVNLMIGPTEQVDAYEAYLGSLEPGARLVRLYPRDFWIE